LPPISLERILQVIFGEDRKNKSSYYFFIWAFFSLHRFELALHVNSMMLFPYSMLFFLKNKKKKKKKIEGENAGNLIFSFIGMSDIVCIFA
jgi:hypothetical protein